MENSEYIVSVIMPAFNAEATIKESALSVLNQSYDNLELIVIDDNSTDSTLDILDTIKDNRLKIVKTNLNVGAGQARNVGLRFANGRYISFLDADDLWKENKIAKQVAFMQKEKIALSHTLYQEFDRNNLQRVSYSPSIINYEKLKKINFIGCLTVMIDRKITGDFSFTSLKRRQDYALWLELSRNYDFHLLNEVLALYRIDSPNSLSKNKLRIISNMFSVYRQERESIISAFYLTIRYIFLYFLKRSKFVNKLE